MTEPIDPSTGPEPQRILDDLEALKVYFDPLRTRIIEEVAHQPRTVHEIADALDVPFTRLYYHIKLLEKHGIIRVVATRAMQGAVEEKHYQVTARQFVVARDLLTVVSDDHDDGLEVVLATILDQTRQDIRASVHDGRINLAQTSPDPDSLLIRRGVMRLSREQAAEFQRELVALLNRMSAQQRSPDDPSTFYAVQVALYPSSWPERQDQDEDT